VKRYVVDLYCLVGRSSTHETLVSGADEIAEFSHEIHVLRGERSLFKGGQVLLEVLDVGWCGQNDVDIWV